MSNKEIDIAFFDITNYTMCRAIAEAVGTEDIAKIFKRAGEIHFNELKKKIKIEETELIPLLKKISKYLTETGYMEKIEITEINPKELVIDMWGGAAAEGNKRLIKEGYAPSHTMTNLMFSALKKVCSIEAEE